MSGALELAAEFRQGWRPDWTAQDAKRGAVLVDALVQSGAFDLAAEALGALERLHPTASVLQTYALLLRTAPPPSGDPAYDGWRDEPTADVQVVRRRGATRLLLVFTGIGGRIGIPLALAHRWLAALDAHVVYLRDAARQAYTDGVRGLGLGYAASLDGLWRLVEELSPGAILTCGNSVGGYGALRYGLDLRAQSILGFSAATSLAPPLMPVDEVRRRGFRVALDLKPFFLAADPPPRTLLVYGADCSVDVRQAEHLATAPGVTLRTLPGCDRHEAVLRCIELGMFDTMLQHLVTP